VAQGKKKEVGGKKEKQKVSMPHVILGKCWEREGVDLEGGVTNWSMGAATAAKTLGKGFSRRVGNQRNVQLRKGEKKKREKTREVGNGRTTLTSFRTPVPLPENAKGKEKKL